MPSFKFTQVKIKYDVRDLLRELAQKEKRSMASMLEIIIEDYSKRQSS